MASYLVGTARWREAGVVPGGCIVSVFNYIQEFSIRKTQYKNTSNPVKNSSFPVPLRL